jgi:hypothetical protein
MNWLKRCSSSYGTARNLKRCGHGRRFRWGRFLTSDDEDIIEAVQEALAMAEEPSGDDEDGEDDAFPE